LAKPAKNLLSSSSQTGLSIEAIPAFSDNYIWLLHGEGTACAVVDPGEAEPVLKTLAEKQLDLQYIILTHHHWDHTNGVPTLLEHFPDVEVFGPHDSRIQFRHIACEEGDEVELRSLELKLKVLDVPAHTRSHIAFHGHGMLFSGDTLFSVGCGKLFEGNPEQMQAAMDKFAALPPTTLVYCGHEYTLSNCEFALRVEPRNQALLEKTKTVKGLRDQGDITLPAVLGEELEVNPFMRTRQESVVTAAQGIDPTAQPGAGVLGVIRQWKDTG